MKFSVSTIGNSHGDQHVSLAALTGQYVNHRLVRRLPGETPARNRHRYDRESGQYGDVQGDTEVGRYGCGQDGVLKEINTVRIRIYGRGAFQDDRQTLDRVERSA